MDPAAEPIATPASPRDIASPSIEIRQLVVSTLASLAVVFLLVMAVAYFFREDLLALSRLFVEKYGALGVVVGFYVPDAFTVPLPNDAFSTFGLLGGMGFWEVVMWGSVGSLAGGSTGYFLGRGLLGRSRRLAHWIGRRGMERVRTEGAWAVAAGAITPLPYSVFCWAAGALHMPFRVFLAVSSLRVVRVAVYLWLIQLGVVSVVE